MTRDDLLTSARYATFEFAAATSDVMVDVATAAAARVLAEQSAAVAAAVAAARDKAVAMMDSEPAPGGLPQVPVDVLLDAAVKAALAELGIEADR